MAAVFQCKDWKGRYSTCKNPNIAIPRKTIQVNKAEKKGCTVPQ